MLLISQAPKPAELIIVSATIVVISPDAWSLVVISQPSLPRFPNGFMAMTGECKAVSPPKSVKDWCRNCMYEWLSIIPVVGDSRIPFFAQTDGSSFAAVSRDTNSVGTPSL